MIVPARSSKKRKQHDGNESLGVFSEAIDMEMLSDEEDGEEVESDNGDVDEFPEIDAGSDESSEKDENDESGDEDEDEDEDEEDEVNREGSDDSHEELRIFPKAKTIVSGITGQEKRVYPEIEPEYDSDSSTEDTPNRVGDIPMHWYDDLPHVGYDMDGKRVLKPARGDELDRFLETVEDPNSWISAFDKTAQADKPLTAQELDIIQRLYANENPDANYDPYEPLTEWFTGQGKEEIMPLTAAPEPKRRWVPSKWEHKKVMKIVRAIRQGRILPNKAKNTSQPPFYAIWSDTSPLHAPPLPAPKPRLPSNFESYNPPEEYLPSEEDRKQWEETDPEDRERDYIPHKYSALRLVPGYDRFIKDRFNRQLDLYMAPRVQRVKLNIDPNSLIPKLPSPNSLKPYPTYRSLQVPHQNMARCISVSPDGAWVVSGDEGGVVGLWEVNVGREVKKWKFNKKIGSVEWCPRTDVIYFVVGTEDVLHFLIPPNLPPSVLQLTQSILAPSTLPPAPEAPSPVKWSTSSSNTWSDDNAILTVHLPPSSGLPSQITWHRRGDYLASVSIGAGQGAVWIHQVSRRHSQAPFKKVRGKVQLVLFHPMKPCFFVATQQYVRMYNLSEQKLLKTLQPGIKWISSMDVHPSGDHLIVGGYDRKLCWFDLELSDKPYKVLRYHTRAIRSLHFHPTYPLFASSSDDGVIQIFHARVYNDLMTDPLIVPLKILRGHEVTKGLGVLQVKWCSRHPWLISGGADGAVNVWCS
ncbi:NUC169 domain-containing protein [Lentinula aff. detonsa]|nr:NUC169 domain-containing protein [Lentinula aff. detonsa]